MRAFLALNPDADAHEVLCRYRRRLLEAPWARHVKWTAEANLHMTIRFLGDIDAAVDAALTERLEAALGRPDAPGPLELNMTEPRFFPSAQQPRTIACLVAATSGLTALATLAETTAQSVGLAAADKPFRGHITLGRTRPTWPSGVRLEIAPALTRWRADALVLYRSDLRPDGPRYTVLRRFMLSGGA
ncbi:MAG: RNA 2',3'-cyclic phosphodiesterase [Chloracidobacterium sp.]|nr:RNA 2',3'-cyclic phosphodiesterase [Chloracidobacterium sp.]MDW8218864.1 RNA 2',3'-cyclic phosphodiesterase [Acidobacteriota bacterium]